MSSFEGDLRPRQSGPATARKGSMNGHALPRDAIRGELWPD